MKKISATVTATETISTGEANNLGQPYSLERSNSINRDISDIETQMSPSEAESIREELEDENIIEELQG